MLTVLEGATRSLKTRIPEKQSLKQPHPQTYSFWMTAELRGSHAPSMYSPPTDYLQPETSTTFRSAKLGMGVSKSQGPNLDPETIGISL